MTFLPKMLSPKAPPIKTQGIKTKLLPLIAGSIRWDGRGRWIEPFLGSGAVAFNIAPQRAILADTNCHIVNFYSRVQAGEITGASARDYLQREGARLLETGESWFYMIRDRFNETGNSLDFLFLSRSCFNGVMRFNSKGRFNVPFCRKPNRFRQALVTKIANQIDWTAQVMRGKDWQFITQTWDETVASALPGDLIYCDPPYVGRHTDYFNGFSDADSERLASALTSTRADFALSMWLENKYRRNDFLARRFDAYEIKTLSHFYHVGSSEDLRNEMTEALVLSPAVVANGLPIGHATGLPQFESAIPIES